MGSASPFNIVSEALTLRNFNREEIRELCLCRYLVAVNLLRKYGRNDAVYFYNQGFEVDFYIPDAYTAIQVCYSLNISDGTFDREIKGLLKITEVLECKKLLVIARDTERTLEASGKTIDVVPAWKWLLCL